MLQPDVVVHTVSSSTREVEASSSLEFEASPSYLERHCLGQKTQKRKKEENVSWTWELMAANPAISIPQVPVLVHFTVEPSGIFTRELFVVPTGL